MTGGEPVVQLREVFCVHRTAQGDAAALQGLDLELRPAEVVCVLGPSGAGKSTLLRVVGGLQPPSAGSVRLLGRDIGRGGARARAAMRNRYLGFLEQSSQSALAAGLTLKQAVMLPLAIRGAGRDERSARAEELLAAVGLVGRANVRPQELSGGERQRVALCAALAHGPAVLLADEPTGELDRASADAVYELMVSLIRSAGASAIIASHDPAASRHADRTIGLRDGRVVEERGTGAPVLIVGRGGWVRLPETIRARAGLGDRVEPRATGDGLLLAPIHVQPSPPDTPARATEPAVEEPRQANGWKPARVELASLGRSYRQGRTERPVLNRLTHAFAPGALTVVTGRSGSGKTTLLRLIAGLDRPQAGEVTLDGLPLVAQDAEERAALRRRRIGFMAQDPAPIGFLSPHENVVLTLRIRGWDPAAAEQRARTVLELVGLSERAKQRVSRLSAGELQRAALARALAGARGLLVVDEPTSRLDEANAHAVAGLLARAASLEGQTVICASHDPAVVARAQERLALDV